MFSEPENKKKTFNVNIETSAENRLKFITNNELAMHSLKYITNSK